MALFSKNQSPKRPFNLSNFLVIVGVSIVLVNIVARVIGVFVESFAEVAKQVTMGTLFMVVIVAVLTAFMLVKRQVASGAGISSKDLLFILLTIGFVIFLLIVIPNLFGLPGAFSVANIQLQSMFVP